MNTQINIRLPENLLKTAKRYADKNGFGTVQDLVKEALREKVYEDVTEEEMDLIKRVLKVTNEKKLWGTEKELFEALKRK